MLEGGILCVPWASLHLVISWLVSRTCPRAGPKAVPLVRARQACLQEEACWSALLHCDSVMGMHSTVVLIEDVIDALAGKFGLKNGRYSASSIHGAGVLFQQGK